MCIVQFGHVKTGCFITASCGLGRSSHHVTTCFICNLCILKLDVLSQRGVVWKEVLVMLLRYCHVLYVLFVHIKTGCSITAWRGLGISSHHVTTLLPCAIYAC